jgi:hypothetical protein
VQTQGPQPPQVRYHRQSALRLLQQPLGVEDQGHPLPRAVYNQWMEAPDGANGVAITK